MFDSAIVLYREVRCQSLLRMKGLIMNFYILVLFFSVVTVYATLGDEALIHGINETDVRFIITDASLLHKLSALIDRLPKVEHIVYLGNVVKKSALLGFSRRVKVHSMHEVEEIGESQDDSKYETFD